MEELSWFARGVVATGISLGLWAVFAPDQILGGLDRRTLGLAAIFAIVGGAILVAIAGA